MKKSAPILVVVLLVSLLASCTQVSNLLSSNKPIQPGDKIGDFLITTGEPGEATYSWDLDCIQQGSEEIYACKSDIGTPVNVTLGIYDSTLSGELDSVWSDHTYELWINDRPVDLEAFGPIDFMNPRVGPMRAWNVVLLASEPGEITIHNKGVVDGDPFEDTTTYTFSEP